MNPARFEVERTLPVSIHGDGACGDSDLLRGTWTGEKLTERLAFAHRREPRQPEHVGDHVGPPDMSARPN
jgi:hypothetical protein